MKKFLSRIQTILFVLTLIIVIIGTPDMLPLTISLLYTHKKILIHNSFFLSFTSIYLISLLYVCFTLLHFIYCLKKSIRENKLRDQIYASKLHDIKCQADLSHLLTEDLGFSKDKFLVRAKKIYLSLINSLQTNNTNVLHLLINADSADCLEQLKLPSSKEATYKTVIRETHLTKYEQGETDDYLVVGMVVELNVLSQGQLQEKLIKKCLLTFNRKRGIQTNTTSDLFDSEHCPHCGAPLAISVKGYCQYCHQEVSSGKFEWCIYDIDEDLIETIPYK